MAGLLEWADSRRGEAALSAEVVRRDAPIVERGALDLVVDAGNGNTSSRSCSAPVWVVDRCPHAAS
jgi:hypothetical protein